MNKADYKTKKVDRSSWKSGPWDNEPDYYEWTTNVGYFVWMGRLDSGAWFAIIEAPCPTDGTMLLAFSHTLCYKINSSQFGMIDKTDKEDIGGFVYSMEHWESPGPSKREWYRGPYKTLEETKQFCEELAQDIFDTHKEG